MIGSKLEMACSLLYQEFFSKAMQKESVVNTRKCNAREWSFHYTVKIVGRSKGNSLIMKQL